jgi:2-polyprenyl-6-methoxyphenol hydroxylase-like FAD-dependent oxidoreductase
MTRNNRLSVLIIGASVAGLTTAYWLRRYGHTVRLIERAPRPRTQGFMIDFYGPGYSVAEEMRIVPDLAKLHQEIPQWSFETMAGMPLFTLPYATVRRRTFGYRHFNVLRSDLERLLLALIRDDVDFRPGVALSTLEACEGCMAATLSDGTPLVCDLVVGAGGVHSPTRRILFGDGGSWEHYLGLDAAAFSVDDAEIRRSVGKRLRTLSGPGRQATVYPTGGGQVGAFFVHERVRTLDDRSAAGVVHELRRVYGDFGDVVRPLLSRAEEAPDLFYDAVAQVRLPQWSLGRVVLVGDACHCVSALGAQGASLEMAGARSLAQALRLAGGDIEAALRFYERVMRPAVSRAQAAGQRIAGWVAPRSGVKLAARDLALRAAVWPLASSVMRRMVGATERID